MAPSKRLLRSANSLLSYNARSATKPQFLPSACRRCQSNIPGGPKATPPGAPGLQRDDEPVRLLSEVVAKKGRLVPKKPEPKGKDKGRWGGIAYPKTRLAVGVIFLSILAYDMVRIFATRLDSG